ncbi:hypothetical protein AAFC00_004199 [Neodothiora populina]|uniref:Uncharacterized protein n=1 Tax=Neodothiora populina TaxID=2781224 RepID=A0ABR3PIW3_9PEZI
MLDESLPAFFYKRSPDGLLHNTSIFFSQHGSEPQPAYLLQRADPSAAYAKNCYAAAIFDSYNPEVLYGEVMIKPEWTQASLSAEEIRRNNGITPPPSPILPTEFTIQLYNPDQQVVVVQRPGSWGGSASYEFSMPQTTFRTPSASCLDRTQNDPAASATTPKLNFVWRKESKLAKDLTCYMTGKSTATVVKRKHRDPDITVALYRSLRELTIYQPNLYRVEMEDPKGLEVVLLLGAAIIKDLYFSSNIHQTFNVSEPARKASPRLALGPVGPLGIIPMRPNGLAAKRKSLPRLETTPPSSAKPAVSPPADPRTQWDIDAETARLRAQVEAEERQVKAQEAARRRERERADEAETQRLRRMVEAEQREAAKRQEAIDRETERLRREYGVPQSPPQQQPQRPPVPARDERHSAPTMGAIPEDHYQHHQPVQPPQQPLRYHNNNNNNSNHLRPGPHAPQRQSNGLYLQPSGSRAHASSAAVMSGGNPSASASASADTKRRMKKKSFFGLRSSSDDSTSRDGVAGQQKLQKKASAMW